jgi:uncharacterized protein (DUF885 family)
MTRAAWFALPLALAACAAEPPPPAAPAPAVPSVAPAAASTAPSTPSASTPTWDAVAFRTAIDEALGAYFAASPETATRIGVHAFDDQLPDVSEAAQLRVAADLRTRADGLRTIAKAVPERAEPKEAGTDRPALDAALLADRLEDTAYMLDTDRRVERDPSWILGVTGTAILGLVDHEYAPKHDRMNALATRLARIPGVLDVARARLKAPSRAALENLAIVGKGLPSMLRGASVGEWQKGLEADAPLQQRLAKGAADVASAIDAYVKSVTAQFPVGSAKDVPIGAQKWATLARLHEGVTRPPAEVRAMGEKEIARLDAELDALIATSGGGAGGAASRKAFFARLEKDAPKVDGVLDEYRGAQKRVDAWMHEHPLVDVPWNEVSLQIVPSPPHMRGVSFASMNAAGALDAVSDARFQVTEPDAAMPEAQRAALLRFHALGAIDMVSVHEAIPGHYLQYLFIRDVPSKVRKVTWASTLGEGWAHYCEQMALENGFGGGDPRIHAFYLRMALQRAARVVVDVAENDGSMTLAQGAKFLEENALLAPEAAKIEARRAVVWPANMFTYTYGKLAILAARDAQKAKEGSAFDLRAFHDRLLAVGGMPVDVATQVAFSGAAGSPGAGAP